jgi:hypothetical protein
LEEISDAASISFHSQQVSKEFEGFIGGISKTTELKVIFNHLNRQVIDPFNNKRLYWLKKSLQDCAYLFLTGYYPITEELEGDLVRRVWSFVEESSDSSELNFRRYYNLNLK